MGGGGGKSPSPPAVAAGPSAADEYRKRMTEMESQRTKDLAAMRARMGAGGMDSASSSWEQGLQTVMSSYDKKLEELNNDPYFRTINKRSSFDVAYESNPGLSGTAFGNTMPGKILQSTLWSD